MNVQGVGGKPSVSNGTPIAPRRQVGGTSFQQILDSQMDGGSIKISSHAQRRLQSREIHLGTEEMQRLGDAVDKADRKGARESLILMDELALVVSIPNRTVITAMQKDRAKESVFTNIDSVVIV